MRKLNSTLWVIVIVLLFTGHSYGIDPVGWGASYGIFWDMNTSEDEVLDANGPYLFRDWWTFSLSNMLNVSLPNPKITATLDGTLSGAGINANKNPPNGQDVTLEQGPNSYVWSMSELLPIGQPNVSFWMAGGLRTMQPIPGMYTLGYDVTRQISGGREVAVGATDEERTFTMTLTPQDPSLSHIGASIDFTGGVPGPNPGPVSTSNVSCSGPGTIRMNLGMPVFWSIGYPEFALEAGLTHTLTCTLKLTNSVPTPSPFMPGAVVTGAHREPPIIGTGSSMTYASGQVPDTSGQVPDTSGQVPHPPDRLGGTVKFEIGAPGVNGSLDVIFSRSVIFYGVNGYAPTTTATVSPTPIEGWNNTPVTVTLTAADTGGSGVKQIWYWLRYICPGNPPPPPSGTPPIAVPGGTATITDFKTTCFTQVNYSAEDFAGNREDWKSVTVRIDTTPPSTAVWTQPPPRSNGGQNWWNVNVVTVMINASDPCNPGIPCSGPRRIWYKLAGVQTSPLTSVDVQTMMPPQALVRVSAPGTTTVTYYAEDLAGNFESPKTYVVNIDRTSPVIGSVNASPGVLWPPNHNMVSITLKVTVSDNVTPTPVCRVVSVASNELLNGTGDGNTALDWEFTGMNLRLRAERAGNLIDRIYTVAVQCRDAAGNNSAPKTVAIVVPHDQGKKK